MSLASMIGPGYSGYAIVAGIPIPLLSGSGPENENMIKSPGSYGGDPSRNVGQIPARNRRSLTLALSTFLCPRTLPLVKHLVYNWRTYALIDYTTEVPFTYISGNKEGYQGLAYPDDVAINCRVENFVTLDISLTSWVFSEIRSLHTLPIKIDAALSPLTDAYKPIAFWKTIPSFSAIGANSIPQDWTLQFKNNWNYQAFLAGYNQPPNPGLVTAGDLDATFSISWVAARNDRPRETGSLRLQLGVPEIDHISIDRLIRDPSRSYEGVGSGDEAIKWAGSYYTQGDIPRSA